MYLFLFFFEHKINDRGANTDARSVSQTCVLLALWVVGLWQDWCVPVPDPCGQSGTNGHKTFSFPDCWPGQVIFT